MRRRYAAFERSAAGVTEAVGLVKRNMILDAILHRMDNGGMLYMVVEHFRNKDAVTVYRRFRDSGRMAPEGLIYLRVGWISPSSAVTS